MRTRIIISTCFILLLLGLGSLSTYHWAVSQNPITVDEAQPSSIDFEFLLDDPNIDQEPNVVINGTSNEFSSSYHPAIETDSSYIELTWNHTAGTKLDFVGQDPEGIMPDYNDFIYMYQEFEWPYEEMPRDVEFRFNISTIRTGDFAEGAQPYNNLMFREYVWVIDSSGDWTKLYESREATYTETIQEKYASANYFHLDSIFRGMIEQDGEQEDPTDIARVAIGLAPYYRFEQYLGTEPWTYYDGTVSLRVHSIEFMAIRETESDMETHLIPQSNETYSTIFSDVYPAATMNETSPLTERVYDITSDPAGNVYITGEIYTPYELQQQTGIMDSHQFLIKYSPKLKQQWISLNNNGSRGRAVAYHDGSIYTAGCYYYDEPKFRDLVVTKWSSNGDKVWETEWGTDYDQVGVAIGVHDDGSVYVMASDFNYRGPEIWDCYDATSLLKFDSSGNLLWNQSILWSTQSDAPSEMRVYDAHIFYTLYGFSMFLDLDGTILRYNSTGNAISDNSENVYAARYRYEYIDIWKWNSNETRSWNQTYQLEYLPNYTEMLEPVDVALTPSNEFVILTQARHYDRDYYLIKYSPEGELLNTWTIGDDSWLIYGPYQIYTEVTSGNRLYCTWSTGDIIIQSFLLQEEEESNIPVNIILLISIGASIIVVIAVVVYISKKRT